MAAPASGFAQTRHSVTHWIGAVTFLGLMISSFAILLAHARIHGLTYGSGALSLGIATLFPQQPVLLGRRQSARTLRFLASMWLIRIAAGNVVMLWLAGLWKHARSAWASR